MLSQPVSTGFAGQQYPSRRCVNRLPLPSVMSLLTGAVMAGPLAYQMQNLRYQRPFPLR